ncbi:hypothetical protein AOC36_01160 [Erysipelothrix larvae]|uniref:ABC-2 type transporter transmembrane domain-containing protein n=1 Tax=Erysipelothrix larvae TaxID=1514105 RepID=A0A0X8GY99_9FIRM|nr:ABC transporter permease [Erysipelothrix larvae]AMC92651.1 hypothetical protein AOC36_01160 [Erysipelothrix larvae]
MKRFNVVFNFELKSLLFKKSVIISTLVIAVVAFGITFVPRFASGIFDSESGESEGQFEVVFDDTFGLLFENEADRLLFVDFIKNAQIFTSEEELKAAVIDRTIDEGIVFHSATNFTSYLFDTSLANMGNSVAYTITQTVNFNLFLEQNNVDPNVVTDALSIPIQTNQIALGTDGTQGLIFVYIFIFVTYFLILLYGANVSTSVAREKDNRTMELLITSTQPRVLILGKVFSAGIVGIVQFLSIVGITALGVFLNHEYIPESIMSLIGGNMSWDAILVFLVFSIFGYILYLFIYAALGSLVSKVEDVNSAVQPVTFVFVIAYFVAAMSMNLPDAGFVKISSYIPFTSLFTMPIRYLLTSVNVIELLLSLLTIVGTTAFIAMISIYIYRYGSLNYGNKLKLKDVFIAWRRGE